MGLGIRKWPANQWKLALGRASRPNNAWISLCLAVIASAVLVFTCCWVLDAPLPSPLARWSTFKDTGSSSVPTMAAPHLDTIFGNNASGGTTTGQGKVSPWVQAPFPESRNASFWEALVRTSTHASRLRLQRLYSPTCIQYYGARHEMAFSTLAGLTRNDLPLVTTREDLCPKGREDVWRPHTSQEVIILPKQRVIYIIGKKCGSSTTRHFFETFFGVAFRNTTDAQECTKANLRAERTCHSLALDETIVNTFFIFGITRDPVQRFYSALKEANFQATLDSLPVPYRSRDDILRLLTSQMGVHGTCGYNRHLESQLTELFTPFSSTHRAQLNGGDRMRMLPLDFLGSVDNLAEDVVTALILASQRTGIPLDECTAATYLNFLNATHFRPSTQKNETLTEPIDKARDSDLDALIRSVYGQDMACLV